MTSSHVEQDEEELQAILEASPDRLPLVDVECSFCDAIAVQWVDPGEVGLDFTEGETQLPCCAGCYTDMTQDCIPCALGNYCEDHPDDVESGCLFD